MSVCLVAQVSFRLMYTLGCRPRLHQWRRRCRRVYCTYTYNPRIRTRCARMFTCLCERGLFILGPNNMSVSPSVATVEKALSLLGRLCSGFGVEGATQAYMERRGLRGFLAVVILQEVCPVNHVHVQCFFPSHHSCYGLYYRYRCMQTFFFFSSRSSHRHMKFQNCMYPCCRGGLGGAPRCRSMFSKLRFICYSLPHYLNFAVLIYLLLALFVTSRPLSRRPLGEATTEPERRLGRSDGASAAAAPQRRPLGSLGGGSTSSHRTGVSSARQDPQRCAGLDVDLCLRRVGTNATGDCSRGGRITAARR